MCDTLPSRVVPHHSTTKARTSLTAQFRWDGVTLVDMIAHVQPARQKVYIAYALHRATALMPTATGFRIAGHAGQPLTPDLG